MPCPLLALSLGGLISFTFECLADCVDVKVLTPEEIRRMDVQRALVYAEFAFRRLPDRERLLPDGAAA